MTDFARVNDGVAFASGETFTSADANTIRTDLDVGHTDQVLTLRQHVVRAGNYLAGAEEASLGAFFFDPRLHAYVAMSSPYSTSTPTAYDAMLATVGAAGNLNVIGVARPDATVAQDYDYRPIMCGFASTAVLVYHDTSGTYNTGVAVSNDWLSWAAVYSAGTSVAFRPGGAAASARGAAAVYAGSALPRIFIPGHDASGAAILDLTNTTGSTVTATVRYDHTDWLGYFNSVAVDTAGTTALVIGDGLTSGSDQYYVRWNEVAGTFVHYTISMPAASDTVKYVAYDPISAAFVVMAAASSGGGYAGDLYFLTSTDGLSWNAAKRVPLPSVLTAVLHDFWITPAGLWFALFSDSLQGCFAAISLDGGATWSLCGLGRYSEVTGRVRGKIARGGDLIVVVKPSPDEHDGGHSDAVLVGGGHVGGTTYTAVAA